ncbi:polysaccharide deacetylase family protein [Mangrovivirga sp. M17]|uniref:Polysaccharide deacetylase family protein n=1 Tax=Mangrovivirga halotolerans TaxID=2993936 RepID=A0ABT3RQV4_9BACT|nr:polysaccharide deacetylase family protein [Mangrovivirga halotolerans]MCX2744161.1 polysaccharide deacetylase family protein [Mangrovivirga halotolerans]
MKNILSHVNSGFIVCLCFLIVFSCSSGNTKNETKSTGMGQKKDGKHIVCFVYHRFGDSRFPSTNISLSDFEAHLKYLKENDYQVLNFSDAIDYLKSEESNKKTAVLTIDDGYESFYNNGLPLLKKYGFSATLYVNTESIGGSDYMSWDQIRKAHKSGIEIGNHTHSHQYFLNLDTEERYVQFEEEIVNSQKLFKSNLGIEPVTFAYPFGEYDGKMKEIVRASGFKSAAAQNSGVIYSGTDLMACPRFPMSESYSDINSFSSKAKMKPMIVINEEPSSLVITRNRSKPLLNLEIQADSLDTGSFQCFIQGSECNLDIREDSSGSQVNVTLQSKSSILDRRRTLYTITGKDTEGNWHWYSHLWVNPEVK